MLAESILKTEKLISIRLGGADKHEVAEVFGKVINTGTGVVEAKRLSSMIVSDNPQASYAVWRLKIEDTDPFRLQSNILKMIKDILHANGEIHVKGVPYRYTTDELNLLIGSEAWQRHQPDGSICCGSRSDQRSGVLRPA